jgi:death-on-curing protein
LHGYGEPSLPELAAAYAFGIARNHPFVDGNKRTALVVAELFLGINGYDLTATDLECVEMFLPLAAGEVSEQELAAWIGRNCRKREK